MSGGVDVRGGKQTGSVSCKGSFAWFLPSFFRGAVDAFGVLMFRYGEPTARWPADLPICD